MKSTIGRLMLIALVALCAFGSVIWNGAGFSLPDDLYAAQLRCCEFRPLLGLSYQFNAKFGGWMLTNFGLHLAAALLVFAVSGNVIAACLFAAHPMAADSVASVAGRSSLVLAVMVLVGAWTIQRWRKVGIFLLIVGAVLAMGFQPGYWFTIQGPGYSQHVHQFASAIGTYVIPRMIVPIGLSADPETHYSVLGEIAGWLLMPLALPLVPYLSVPTPDVFFEHRAYLALAWVSIIAGWLFVRYRSQRYAHLLVLLLIVLSVRRSMTYSTPLSLWEDAALASPGKARAHLNFGCAYFELNRYDEAEREFTTAAGLDPTMGLAWKNLAAVRLLKGDPQAALRIFETKQQFMKGL